MLSITIAFDVDQQQWSHDFRIPRGSTVRALKQEMLGPGAVTEDVDAFELQGTIGQRLHDASHIAKDATLNFQYLGQEEGAKRAELDRRTPAPRPDAEVDVTVKHATEAWKGQITVKVKGSATVGDVRKAVLGALGEVRLSEVKLVRWQGGAYVPLDEAEKLGDSREFLSTGRALHDGPAPAPEPEKPAPPPPPPPPAPPEPAGPASWTVTVTIDRALGFQMPVDVVRGETIWTVKEKMAATDPTGSLTPDSFGLGISPPEGSDERAVALPNDTVLTQAHSNLDTADLL